MIYEFSEWSRRTFGTGVLVLDWGREPRPLVPEVTFPPLIIWKFQLWYFEGEERFLIETLEDLAQLARTKSVKMESEFLNDPVGWADFICSFLQIEDPIKPGRDACADNIYAKYKIDAAKLLPIFEAGVLKWYCFNKLPNVAFPKKISDIFYSSLIESCCLPKTLEITTREFQKLEPPIMGGKSSA